MYAPDDEAYRVFGDLFDPIIEDYHGGFKKTDKHPNKVGLGSLWGRFFHEGRFTPCVGIYLALDALPPILLILLEDDMKCDIWGLILTPQSTFLLLFW